MKDKAIFLDRDGVINLDKGYVHKIEDLEYEKNSILGLQSLSKLGYKIIIMTNQSGVGRGIFEEKLFHYFTRHLIRELQEKGVKIERKYYYCLHHPDAGCSCRKPKPLMLQMAANDFNLDLSQCYFIGDRGTDIEFGKNCGCKTIMVMTGKQELKETKEKPDYVAQDLLDAAQYITQNDKN